MNEIAFCQLSRHRRDELISKHPDYHDLCESDSYSQILFKNPKSPAAVKREGGVGKHTLLQILPSWYTDYKDLCKTDSVSQLYRPNDDFC